MKQAWLMNIFVALTVGFLLALGYLSWQNKTAQAKSEPVPAETVAVIADAPIYPVPATYQVPILMYHYIRDAADESQLGQNLSVHPDNFARQMQWLKDNQYSTISLTDLADPAKNAIAQTLGQNKKPIIITFDDGYKDAYTDAWPILQKQNFTATFFIIRQSVGLPAYMNQTEINALAAAGMEIGSHSLSHPSLEKTSEANQRTEIFDSKMSAQTFCYPSGKYNDTTLALIKEAGYLAAVTTQNGMANEQSNLWELPRVRIENGDGEYLKKQLQL